MPLSTQDDLANSPLSAPMQVASNQQGVPQLSLLGNGALPTSGAPASPANTYNPDQMFQQAAALQSQVPGAIELIKRKYAGAPPEVQQQAYDDLYTGVKKIGLILKKNSDDQDAQMAAVDASEAQHPVRTKFRNYLSDRGLAPDKHLAALQRIQKISNLRSDMYGRELQDLMESAKVAQGQPEEVVEALSKQAKNSADLGKDWKTTQSEADLRTALRQQALGAANWYNSEATNKPSEDLETTRHNQAVESNTAAGNIVKAGTKLSDIVQRQNKAAQDMVKDTAEREQKRLEYNLRVHQHNVGELLKVHEKVKDPLTELMVPKYPGYKPDLIPEMPAYQSPNNGMVPSPPPGVPTSQVTPQFNNAMEILSNRASHRAGVAPNVRPNNTLVPPPALVPQPQATPRSGKTQAQNLVPAPPPTPEDHLLAGAGVESRKLQEISPQIKQEFLTAYQKAVASGQPAHTIQENMKRRLQQLGLL